MLIALVLEFGNSITVAESLRSFCAEALRDFAGYRFSVFIGLSAVNSFTLSNAVTLISSLLRLGFLVVFFRFQSEPLCEEPHNASEYKPQIADQSRALFHRADFGS